MGERLQQLRLPHLTLRSSPPGARRRSAIKSSRSNRGDPMKHRADGGSQAVCAPIRLLGFAPLWTGSSPPCPVPASSASHPCPPRDGVCAAQGKPVCAFQPACIAPIAALQDAPAMQSQHSTAHADPTALLCSLCTSAPLPRAPDEPQQPTRGCTARQPPRMTSKAGSEIARPAANPLPVGRGRFAPSVAGSASARDANVN